MAGLKLFDCGICCGGGMTGRSDAWSRLDAENLGALLAGDFLAIGVADY